ncbi:MAG: ATP phosphoribosyltransferase regulatory subunit [Thermomicrobiales bacterium]
MDCSTRPARCRPHRARRRRRVRRGAHPGCRSARVVYSSTWELVQQRNLDTGPIDELSEVTRIVEASGFEAANIRIDLGLGRGLRYYTGMLFEVYAGLDAGLQIAGGGRYDDLARQLGARNQVPSGGFSIGLDRLLFSGNRRIARTLNTGYSFFPEKTPRRPSSSRPSCERKAGGQSSTHVAGARIPRAAGPPGTGTRQ